MAKATRKVTATNPALTSWVALNDAMRTADEATCKALLREELAGKNRKQFVSRIRSRFNRARYRREQMELTRENT